MSRDINFIIRRAVRAPNGRYVLAEVQYTAVKEYEGKKIILIEMNMNQFLLEKELDPHFKEGAENTVLARFCPTEDGWRMANKYLKMLDPSLPL